MGVAPLAPRDHIPELESLGVTAFTTTRAAGDFALADPTPAADCVERWESLAASLESVATRLASARQVHGTDVLLHTPDWLGWRRAHGADGHLTTARGSALAVTIADCVPVFLAHPSGPIGLLHAGWRGTADRIVPRALTQLSAAAVDVTQLHVHLGPAICGRCYEVSPDVFERLTGWTTIRHRQVDLRALLAEQAKEHGVARVTASPYCTRCDNDRYFSHRAGDVGRQVAVIAQAAGGRDGSGEG